MERCERTLHLLRHGRPVWIAKSFVPEALRDRQDNGGRLFAGAVVSCRIIRPLLGEHALTELVMGSAQVVYRADFVSTIGADYFSRTERGAVEQRAVEIAVEQDETASLAYLDDFDTAP